MGLAVVGVAPRDAAAQESSGEAVAPEQLAFFESRIRPVLIEHCYECHSADAKILRGGLQLDSREGMRKGGESGPAVVPGKPEDSLLLQALRHETFAMPPEEKLPDNVIVDFETWIRNGAADPRDESKPSRLEPVDWEAAKSHWAFQPLREPPVPTVRNREWVQTPIDAFVLAKLEEIGASPAPQADKRTLLRRVTFDLTGLPPTAEEIEAFLNDDSPESFSRVVDRLLASPRYGERWGRHWLDLVRYATSNGADENHALPEAWRYRDWVVRMFNENLPFDQFIVQQLAGDLLPTPADERRAGDLLTATGMLVIGPKMLAEQDKEKMIYDIVDEQIDTVSRTMLGLTMSCARCHDHKFDPISSRDYYALAGVFYSTQSMANRDFVSKWMERPLPSAALAARRAEHLAKIEAAKAELAQLGETADEAVRKEKMAAVEALEKATPQFEMVMAVQEGAASDLPIHLRGNHLRPSPERVPRGMPSILVSHVPAAEIPAERSGRLEMAMWLVSPEHPLTSRVMVNRFWMWHFGQPLMRSPSNWGLQAERPSHPELLDWLAVEFQRSGWSLKALHRMILLSSTYQMSSRATSGVEAALENDPENRLLSRQHRRRLEAEPLRDSILFVGDSLGLAMGGMAPNVDALRRAIYLPVDRAALYEMFSTFDYVETANHLEQRSTTMAPGQSLFLMNSPLVHASARRLAERAAEMEAAGATEGATAMLFERLYGRPPSAAEAERALRFLGQAEAAIANVGDATERRRQAWAALARTMLAANEFIYVE